MNQGIYWPLSHAHEWTGFGTCHLIPCKDEPGSQEPEAKARVTRELGRGLLYTSKPCVHPHLALLLGIPSLLMNSPAVPVAASVSPGGDSIWALSGHTHSGAIHIHRQSKATASAKLRIVTMPGKGSDQSRGWASACRDG